MCETMDFGKTHMQIETSNILKNFSYFLQDQNFSLLNFILIVSKYIFWCLQKKKKKKKIDPDIDLLKNENKNKYCEQQYLWRIKFSEPIFSEKNWTKGKKWAMSKLNTFILVISEIFIASKIWIQNDFSGI